MRNTVEDFKLIMLIALAVSMLFFGQHALAQGQVAPAPTAPAQPDLQAPLVDWTHAKRAHRTAELWAMRGAVLDRKEGDRIPVTGVTGVRVTLRMDGMHLGLGDEVLASAQRGQPTDLMQLTAVAMDRALKAASRELVDRHRRAMDVLGEAKKTPTADQAKPLTLAEIGPRLLVDLQVARELVPVTLAADATRLDLVNSFVPGAQGLMLTARTVEGRSREAINWPASSLAWNIPPESQLRGPARAIAGDKVKLEDIAKPGGLLMHRFDVIHIVRPTKVQPAYNLIRGNDPIPRTALDGTTLDSVGQRMARFMMSQVRENGSLPGAYEPTSDRYEGEFADYKSAGLALYALVRWAEVQQMRGTPEEERRLLSRTIQAMAGNQARQIVGANMVPDPPAMALLAMSIIESPVLAHQKLDRDNLMVGLLRMQNPDGSFRQSFAADADRLRPEDQALVLAALTMHADRTRDPLFVTAVRVGRQWMWSQVRPGFEEETWVWLMLAERLIAESNLPVFMKQAEENQRFTFMQNMAVTISQRQIARPTDDQRADVVGAFVRMNEPWPTWHSAWSTAYLAWAVRTGLVRQDDRLRTLLASALGARFVARLMFDWPACYYVTRPEEVIGGVRGSLIDNRLSIRYTAAGLLSVVELQQTLNRLEQQQMNGSP